MAPCALPRTSHSIAPDRAMNSEADMGSVLADSTEMDVTDTACTE